MKRRSWIYSSKQNWVHFSYFSVYLQSAWCYSLNIIEFSDYFYKNAKMEIFSKLFLFCSGNTENTTNRTLDVAFHEVINRCCPLFVYFDLMCHLPSWWVSFICNKMKEKLNYFVSKMLQLCCRILNASFEKVPKITFLQCFETHSKSLILQHCQRSPNLTYQISTFKS